MKKAEDKTGITRHGKRLEDKPPNPKDKKGEEHKQEALRGYERRKQEFRRQRAGLKPIAANAVHAEQGAKASAGAATEHARADEGVKQDARGKFFAKAGASATPK